MKIKSLKFYNEPTKVVDLQVKDSHNFAIGKDRIIVHNSFIRPRGSIIKGTGILHPGVVSYLEVFDGVANCIVKGSDDGYVDKLKNYYKDEEFEKLKETLKKQTRKGAQIAILNVNHPDIEEFIKAKQVHGKLTKFNLSVGITNDFMEAVINDKMWDLKFNGKICKTVKALDLYNLIMESNYNRAEPGVIFLDNAKLNNPIEYVGSPDACNPCVAKGTKVLIDKFGSCKNVEDFKVGDDVLTIDGVKKVKTIETHKNLPVFKVKFTNGIEIVVTEGHIFHSKYKVEDDWDTNKTVKELKPNNLIRVYNQIVNYYEIENISPFGTSDVYDLYEESTDTWITEGGIVNRGCGEIVCQSDLTTACLLGSVNLTQYVKIDSEVGIYFDYENYCKDIEIFVRMLDNVCDKSNLPLQSYDYFVKNFRQIGIGVNGLGSMLLMLGIPYNSKEAVEMTRKLVKLKESSAWKASALLAKEKGTFNYYNHDKFTATEFFKSDRISNNVKALIKTYGVRNAKVTTNPPLGNSAFVCDYVSNAIEPIYSLDVSRKISTSKWPEGLNSENVKTILTLRKIGDAEIWEDDYNGVAYYYEPHNRGLCEVKVLRDYGYQWLLDNVPETLINNKAIVSIINPNIEDIEFQVYKACGKQLKFSEDFKYNEIMVDDHLNIMEQVQYYNSQSTSKTVNVPKDYSFEDFKNLYIKGWKLGLIGLTTYREGSMESVIEDASSSKKVEIIREVKKDIKLPKQFLNGDTKIIEKEGMKFYIHFSYLPDDVDKLHPIGIWITTNHKNEIKNANKACKKLIELVKRFEIDQSIIDNTWDKCTGDSAHNRVARMISLCMRHNIPKEEILVALNGIDGDNVSTLLSAIRKFISGTIADGVKLKNIKCPQCNSDDLIMQSGCHMCSNCGYSGCM